ncbi:hypothetical protein QWZ13_09640 [Reinekea marina]|uniref:hypothetical protein n=1 Tax=Reinekea marina TaxID=1310421 RepID=UPI0025B399A0|nr:hypothetical protein [Reinekea marina]MDN3649172.1 hypothetical protein [Reinekea marina]
MFAFVICVEPVLVAFLQPFAGLRALEGDGDDFTALIVQFYIAGAVGAGFGILKCLSVRICPLGYLPTN